MSELPTFKYLHFYKLVHLGRHLPEQQTLPPQARPLERIFFQLGGDTIFVTIKIRENFITFYNKKYD